MNKKSLISGLLAGLFAASGAHAASPKLIAIGSVSGLYEDLAIETLAPLENGVPGNRLGGIGSGLAHAGGTVFLALPDRGPNAKPYNSAVDDTTSYISRFQTFNLSLAPSDPGSALPFILTPMLLETTLLSSHTPLYYAAGGAPALNLVDHTHYFTGRSDNFDPLRPSTNAADARFDPEGIRVSNSGKSVFISDEYGPYVYQFDRATGRRVRVFQLPSNLAITNLSAQGQTEIDGNKVGRIANKGMEGLAITTDGKTLVGMMQANLEQDAVGSLRIVTIDISSGKTQQFAYKLTDGSGVSEILAVNDHQFLVDERDGKGRGDKPLATDTATMAAVKKIYLMDLNGATEVSGVTGDLSSYAVQKTLFLDFVAASGIDPLLIPAKLEGMAFGQDVTIDGKVKHTLFIANDNDFLGIIADPADTAKPKTKTIENPNQFFVFAFDDTDLPGYVPQPISQNFDQDKGDD